LGAAKNVTISESCEKWFVAVQTEREGETSLHWSKLARVQTHV